MPFRIVFDTVGVFSCVYRHHRLKPPHNRMEGQLLSFRFTFDATELDDSKRAVDPLSLSLLLTELEKWFGGTMIVTHDDPEKHLLSELHILKVARIVRMDHVGIEAFAKHAHSLAVDFLRITGLEWRVKCTSVACSNGDHLTAIYSI